MEKLFKLLSDTQASLFVLFHKTWIYHWNVVGPNFKEYHDLFGTQYEEMFEEIDRITEHMRFLGMKPVSTLSRITEVSGVEQASNSAQTIDAKTMVEQLMADHKKIIEMLTEVSDEAEKQNSKGTINLVDDLNESHGKSVWKLRSFTENE
jgi:starvation-inducible DNA-binding protein